MSSGYFGKVQIGEPKSAPSEEMTAAIYMDRVGVAELTLSHTIEQHTVIVRLYRNMLAEPEEDIELGLAKLVQDVVSDLLGDYDLGRYIRHVDAAAASHRDAVGTVQLRLRRPTAIPAATAPPLSPQCGNPSREDVYPAEAVIQRVTYVEVPEAVRGDSLGAFQAGV